jgi:hypothetical protein
MRKRTKDLEQAQQALFSARLGVLAKETSVEQFVVHRAKAALGEAEQKLRVIKKWERDFDGRMQPLVKQMEKLHTVLSNDMVQAVAYLTQAISTLSAYAERGSGGTIDSPTPGQAVIQPTESSASQGNKT